MADLLIHRAAADVTAAWIGRELLVGAAMVGFLSDVAQHPTAHRTELWLGGERVDVHESTTVTVDGLGLDKGVRL